ncbi:thioesterase II family protein [Paenactinomyces guangxiensis]|uniref:thioesterase II family protein n=1 Tax=Paenactinomyces guangxiensis TaxID=1490290 RepID=UPI001E29FDA2|nr:alpha/beta fold hydrolase [Paenactinomyces guangxiensis]
MNALQVDTPWLPYNKRRTSASLRLFCFPYGGGNPAVYLNWQNYMPEEIEIFPIQLPGRGIRFKEPSYTKLEPLIRDMAESLVPFFSEPFAFFGHSMGALISFELARDLQKRYQLQPHHLFVSGYHAPHLPDPNPPIHHLPDNEFIEELSKLNGMPRELLQNKDYFKVFLPSLRADCTVCEQYVYRPGHPLDCSITAFGGHQDPETDFDQLRAWQDQTKSAFDIHMFDGDHFFIHSEEKSLIKIILKKLLP